VPRLPTAQKDRRRVQQLKKGARAADSVEFAGPVFRGAKTFFRVRVTSEATSPMTVVQVARVARRAGRPNVALPAYIVVLTVSYEIPSPRPCPAIVLSTGADATGRLPFHESRGRAT
jgi:hypothetical protein